MIRRPPTSTRTYTLFPHTALFRSEIALVTDPLSQLVLLRLRVGCPPIRQRAFAQRVDVLEIERAGRILDEKVEQVDAVHLDPGLELMRALVELCDGAVGIDAGAQVVRGAREARSGQNLAVDLVTGDRKSTRLNSSH